LLQLNMTKLLSPVENAICWYFSIPLPATIPEMYHMGARTVRIDNGDLAFPSESCESLGQFLQFFARQDSFSSLMAVVVDKHQRIFILSLPLKTQLFQSSDSSNWSRFLASLQDLYFAESTRNPATPKSTKWFK
jgi:hypothetical protein